MCHTYMAKNIAAIFVVIGMVMVLNSSHIIDYWTNFWIRTPFFRREVSCFRYGEGFMPKIFKNNFMRLWSFQQVLQVGQLFGLGYEA